jgi:hypothetical protein
VNSARILRRGVNGDSLQEGKLDLPKFRDFPTAKNWALARDVSRGGMWQDDHLPRNRPAGIYLPELAERREGLIEFDTFVTLVRRCGYADLSYRGRHVYWVVDEFKYWTMDWPVVETTIINRRA